MQMGQSKLWTLSAILFSIISSQAVLASDEIPNCKGSGGRMIPVDNAQVLKWKTSTENGYEARAHVKGEIIRLIPDRNDHTHFIIQIGNGPKDVLEVVYNESFGDLPQLKEGMEVEACGDFINSFAYNAPYPASPAGAIIHWVHKSTGSHPDGYVVIEGNLYGHDLRHANPRPQPNHRWNDRRGRNNPNGPNRHDTLNFLYSNENAFPALSDGR